MQQGRRWKHSVDSELYLVGSDLRKLADLQTGHWKLWTNICYTFKQIFFQIFQFLRLYLFWNYNHSLYPLPLSSLSQALSQLSFKIVVSFSLVVTTHTNTHTHFFTLPRLLRKHAFNVTSNYSKWLYINSGCYLVIHIWIHLPSHIANNSYAQTMLIFLTLLLLAQWVLPFIKYCT